MIAASLKSKHPHTTCWLELDEPEQETADATRLHAALRAIGWERETNELPPLAGRRTVTFTKDGTDLFGGWTPEEAQGNLAAVRRVLRRFKLQAPRYRCSFQELM